ncbi:OX-2 membrane glycoprotein-like isoform X3 [Nelusetta ayraudi]|uniref:OX-2 membrane glycoprotein-like isoform X3 n=1 Tax=Nelusetta ayraudi TaxID=303726 RepID=UPI003F6F65F4
MARLTVAHFLCVLGFLPKALPALIETQQTVTAALRDDARLTCRLTQTKDVVQITWHRLRHAENTFLASYTEKYGERVNPKLERKVEFADAALQRTSIVVKNLTEEDKGCYRCMFNTVSEGALTGQTCLQVYELHEPVLRVGGSDSTVVSCWATGRPAPTVSIDVLQKDLQLVANGSVSVANSNGSVTVNTTAVLSGHPVNGKQVVCTAQVFSSSQTTTMIFPDLDEEPEPESRDGLYAEESGPSLSYICKYVSFYEDRKQSQSAVFKVVHKAAENVSVSSKHKVNEFN